MNYQPGRHIIATLHTANAESIHSFEEFQVFVSFLIEKYELQKLGEVYHNFSPAGFTAVICLSESHISIHTWPEHGLINLDIYLSNFQRYNNDTAEDIYQSLKKYFNSVAKSEQIIIR